MKGVPGVMVLLSHVSLLSGFGTLMPCAVVRGGHHGSIQHLGLSIQLHTVFRGRYPKCRLKTQGKHFQ